MSDDNLRIEAVTPSSTASMPGMGTVIAGRYRLERLIAHGGMASVYLATHLTLSRRVAVKLFYPSASGPQAESFRRRFQVEATTLARLDHPNIVVVFDYGDLPDGGCFLVMEYVQGATLEQILRDERPSPERILSLTLQVCEALRYMHARQIVHRDVKLSNILVEAGGAGPERVKVVDFGLVRLLEGEVRLTAVGLIMGSPRFMAPEQIEGGEIDPRTDVYAVGVLLYYALSGRFPFDGETPSQTMTRHLTQEVPPLTAAAPGLAVSGELERITRRCLAKAKDERYQGMDALIEDLRRTAPPPASAASKGWRPWLAPVAAALCAGAVVGLALAIVLQPDRPAQPLLPQVEAGISGGDAPRHDPGAQPGDPAGPWPGPDEAPATGIDATRGLEVAGEGGPPSSSERIGADAPAGEAPAASMAPIPSDPPAVVTVASPPKPRAQPTATRAAPSRRVGPRSPPGEEPAEAGLRAGEGTGEAPPAASTAADPTPPVQVVADVAQPARWVPTRARGLATIPFPEPATTPPAPDRSGGTDPQTVELQDLE